MAQHRASRSAATILAALFLVAAFLPAPAAQAGDTSTMSTRPITILALGDSLTAGYGLAPSQSFPTLIQARLRAEGFNVTIINAGVSGDTTAGGLARLGWALQDAPDAAILELGANDGLMGLEPKAMQRNLEAILDQFKERDIPVLLLGMQALANLGPLYARSYNKVFPRLADDYDTLFYPFLLEGIALKAHLNQWDGIHPNAEGTRRIADNIYPLVKELVAQVSQRRK